MALDILEKLGVDSPDHRLKSYPHELSGGMRQRVAIGISLINKPDLIIADEPTTALDVTIQSQIIYETQKLCKEIGTAIIWITHDLAVVAGLADRVCVMYAGRDVEQGNINAIIDNPKHPYTKGLISSIPANNKRKEPLFQINGIPPSLKDTDDSCSFYNRCNKSKNKCKTEAINNYFVNDRSYRCFIHISKFKMNKDLIKIKNISKSFSLNKNLLETILPYKRNIKRIIKAVNDVTFDIKCGKIVGLVGESGCGKSTLGRIICNILKPDKGEISFEGNDVSIKPLEIQMIFQDPFNSLNPRYRVKNIISEAPLFHKLFSKKRRG